MKKILSFLMSIVLLMGLCFNVAAFDDVDKDIQEHIDLLVALGITKGIDENNFKPDDNVNRQQMATFIYRLMKAGKNTPNGDNLSGFEDLVDPYYNFMISWAHTEGIIKGTSATTFNPTGAITLQDAYTMIGRALGYDETYPIGYISRAESLELDAGLPTSVGYKDALTRGNVAVILANTFYAEMAKSETRYVTTTEDGKTIIKAEEFHPTLAEDVFDVVKKTYAVIGTKTYAFGDAEQNTEDVEIVTIVDEDGNKTDIEFAELGLKGCSDDYFLSDILAFVKTEGDDIEFFGATSLGEKKTVSFDDITFGATKEYYDDAEEYGVFNGLLTIDGVKTYLFKAPYSYTKDEAKEATFIEMTAVDYDKEEGTIAIDYSVVKNIDYDETLVYTDGAYLNQLYFGGLGEVDCYDCNGDGKYEYLFVKPYSLGTIDTAKDRKGITNDTIYTDDMLVEGVVEDEALVTYYSFDNYVKIAETIKGIDTELAEIGEDYFTLENGMKVSTVNINKVVANAAITIPTIADFDTTATWYFTANGRLVATSELSEGFDVNTNWAVIVGDTLVQHSALVNGTLETGYYLDVYYNGKVTSIKVKEDTNIAKYTVVEIDFDKKGYAEFEILATANDDLTSADKEDKVIVTDATITFGKSSLNSMVEINGTRYRVRPYTKILIQSKDKEGETIFTQYDAIDFDTLTLTNASYVVINNVDSTKHENLVMLYGYYDGEIKASAGSAEDIRIVKTVTVTNTKDKTTYYFTLYNPVTGKIETGVEGYEETNAADIKAGTIVNITDKAYVDNSICLGNVFDAGKAYDIDADMTDLGYVEITAIDEDIVETATEDYFFTEDTIFTAIDKNEKTIEIINVKDIDEDKNAFITYYIEDDIKYIYTCTIICD